MEFFEQVNSQMLAFEEVEDDEGMSNMLSNSERSLETGGRLDVAAQVKHRQTAKLKKLR
jgi:hypothetical protein